MLGIGEKTLHSQEMLGFRAKTCSAEKKHSSGEQQCAYKRSILFLDHSTLGHILDSSWGPEVLSDADVLATGSMHGFLARKHFNRCKRLHTLLTTVLKILHLKLFTEMHGAVSVGFMALLQEFATSPCPSLETLMCSLI